MMLPTNVLELFAAQHGLVADFQLLELQPSKTARRVVHRHPDVSRLGDRVLRHRASPETYEQRVMAAVLDAGPTALLWGKSAATHWGFGRFPTAPVHVAVERRRMRGQYRAQIHRIREICGTDRTAHMDVPICRPERTVLWLAGMWTHRFEHEIAAERTGIVLDQAWRQGLIDGRYIHRLAERSGGRGRSGIVVLRAVLEKRPPDYKPAGSRLEERFLEIIPSDIGACLRRQVTVDAKPVIRTVDFLLDRWPLIVEINGEAIHSSLSARAADQERYERLMARGFSVVVFWEYDVWHRAEVVKASMSVLGRTPDSVPTLHRPTPAPWEM